MKRTWVIARNTFKELIREKIFFVFAAVACLIFLLALLLGQLSFSEQNKIFLDVSFFAIEMTMLGLSLFLGGSLLRREVDRQTCLLILARPISRFEFLLGQLLGLVLLQIIFGILLHILIWCSSGFGSGWAHFCVFLSIFYKSLMVQCFVLLLSTSVRSSLAISAGLVFYLLSNALNDLSFAAKKSKDEFFILITNIMGVCLPHFDQLNLKTSWTIENPPHADQILFFTLQTSLWSIFLFLLAYIFWRKKDLVPTN